jgi:hypothetical protein
MGRLPLIVEPDPDGPGFASVYVDGTVAGRVYRFLLDTGAARSRLAAAFVDIDEPVGTEPEHDLLLGEHGHPYLTLCWPGVTGRAVWDSGWRDRSSAGGSSARTWSSPPTCPGRTRASATRWT